VLIFDRPKEFIVKVVAVLHLMVVEFVSGTSGSTSGEIKVYRLMMKAYIAAGIGRILHPNAVSSLTIDSVHIDSDDTTSVVSTVFLFVIGALIGFGAIMFLESSAGEASNMEAVLGLVILSVTNADAAMGDCGPMSPMVSLLPTTKLTMCFLMFFERMEMVFVLMVFTRKFWRDVKQSSASMRGGTKMYIGALERR